MTGYQGKFGRDSAIEFFKRDDWYHQMFIVSGGMILFVLHQVSCKGAYIGYYIAT